jgi:hypothetical protein
MADINLKEPLSEAEAVALVELLFWPGASPGVAFYWT